MGDLKDDLLKTTPTPKMTKLLQELDLTQHITTATRVTLNSVTLIDNAITNMPELIETDGTLPCLVSDHHAIYLHIRWTQSQIEKHTYELWEYQSRDYNALDIEYRNQNWDAISEDDDIDINYKKTCTNKVNSSQTKRQTMVHK